MPLHFGGGMAHPGEEPSRADFERLLELLPEAVLRIHDARLTWVNEAATALLGRPREALIGRPFIELVAPRDRTMVAKRYAARTRGELVPHSYEIDVVREDGALRRVRIEPRVMGDAGVLVLARDLGAQARDTELLRGLGEVVASMQRALNVDSVLTTAANGLHAMGFDVMVLAVHGEEVSFQKALLDPANGREFEALIGERMQESRFRISDIPAASVLIKERKSVFIEHAAELNVQLLRARGADEARVAEAIANETGKFKAHFAPLVVRGEVWGVLGIASRAMDSRDVAALSLFGVQLASAIEVAESVEALERHNRLLGAVHEVAAAGAERDLQRLTERLMGIALDATNSDSVSIFLLNEESGFYEMIANRGCDGPAVDVFRRLAPETLTGEAGEKRRPIAFAHRDLPEPMATAGRELGLVQGATIPLHIEGRVSGSLNVARRFDVPYGTADLEAAELLAGQMAIQIESARLHRDARKRVNELELLNEVGAAVAQHLELDQLLKVAVRNLGRITGACHVFVLLLEQNPDVLRLVASSLEKDDEPLVLTPDTPSTAWSCIREARPIQAYAPFEDGSSALHLVRRFDHNAVLAVPLIAGIRPVGAIVVGYKQKGRRFTREEVDRAVAVGNELAVALANARLYRDLRESYRKLAETQQQLVQRERLAAVGELAAVVAHEVRNPLCVICNSTAPLKRRRQGDSDVAMLLGIVEEESERLNKLVGGMLDFTRTAEPNIRSERVEPILASAVEAARALAAQGQVEVAMRVREGTPAIPLDATMIRQSVLNLLINAIHAMPRGGALAVEAGPDEKERGWLRLEVSDTGHGIPAQYLDRIFDPFFTTKATGSGLGLAVVKRALDAHGGRIEVDSSPDAGTKFVLRFPAQRPAPEP